MSDTGINKFNDNKKESLLELLRNGQGRYAACRQVGIHYTTFRNHCMNDESFQEAVDLAEMSANEQVENALFTACLKGNVTAIQVWLYNRSSDRWTDKRNPAKENDDTSDKLDKLIENMKELAEKSK